jgi:hypothetical protein
MAVLVAAFLHFNASIIFHLFPLITSTFQHFNASTGFFPSKLELPNLANLTGNPYNLIYFKKGEQPCTRSLNGRMGK